MTYPIKTLKQIPVSLDNEAELIDYLLDAYDVDAEQQQDRGPKAEPGSIVLVHDGHGALAYVDPDGRCAWGFSHKDQPGPVRLNGMTYFELKTGEFTVIRGPRAKRSQPAQS